MKYFDNELAQNKEANDIPFNYFYLQFWNEKRKALYRSNINVNILDFYNEALFNVCTDYVVLSDSRIETPQDPFEFVQLILDEGMKDNPYKESFLLSLQFIYQEYLFGLGIGDLTLRSYNDPKISPIFEVTLDSDYHVTQFESINMDLIEQAKIMSKIVFMESKKQIGPHPKVFFHVRKNI